VTEPAARPVRLYLLGRGISHSLSPGMWNRVFARLGLDAWHYGLLDTDEAGLPAARERLADPEVLGFNVTMPYKAWAYRQATVHNADVQRARVGNWLQRAGGNGDRLALANTDVEGARMLLDLLPAGATARVLLLGAGGAAAAMLTALDGRVERVALANRTRDHALALAGRAATWLGPGAVSVLDWDARAREAADAALIVNTTAIGMRDDRSPLDDDLRPRDGTRLYDLVYRPDGPTPLQRQAARWRLPFADGLAHLEAQAVALLPHVGLPFDDQHAELVRSSLALAAGRSSLRWAAPTPAVNGRLRNP
jgi:shikimate dehydrogenase